MAAIGASIGRTAAAARRVWRDGLVEPTALRAAARRGDASIKAGGAPRAPGFDALGQAEIGAELIDGGFVFAGREVRAAPNALWTQAAPTPAWAAEAHGFRWLADLAALGDGDSSDAAVALVSAWLARPLRYDPVVWSLPVVARRTRGFLGVAAEFEAAADAKTVERLRKSLSTHAEWLERRAPSAPAGLTAIEAAAALLAASLAFADRADRQAAALAQLERAAADSVQADGSLVSRAPSEGLEALLLLQAVDRELEARGRAQPAWLGETIDRLAAALRFLRHSDGGLPAFHGGRPVEDGRVDLALAEIGGDGRLNAPAEALPQGGVERLVGGRTRVFLDVGRAPQGPGALTVHASCLAIEVGVGRRRLIVSCGSGAHLDPAWARAGRGAAAHSMLAIDGAAPARFTPDVEGAFSLSGPPAVHVERKEELNGVWVLAAHDGYFAQYGFTTTRRMFLSVDGGDFRGEDSLDLDAEGARIFARRRGRGRGRGEGAPISVRFHLHPDIRTEAVADGEAVTLRLPHGEVWVMRQAGGRLSLEPSVYFDAPAAPRETRQIVIASTATTDGAQIRWAFRRIGELTQAPHDFNALLPFDLDPSDL